jgi:FkbM family methyltransferase
MKLTRKELLFGLGGALVAAPLGAIGQHLATPRPVPPPEPGTMSFAQCGEDVCVDYTCRHLHIDPITYLDIGAAHPIEGNNTYFFYKKGQRGVLVEPNEALCAQLRSVRPHDTTLVAGIGASAAREADFYVLSYPSWSTFDKEEVERRLKGPSGVQLVEVVKRPLLNINEVMAEHFQGAPAFVSIDVEGLELAILQSIDYRRYRPKLICVETLVTHSNRTRPEIFAFMKKQDYVERGGSFVNTIFVDARIL